MKGTNNTWVDFMFPKGKQIPDMDNLSLGEYKNLLENCGAVAVTINYK